MANKFNRKVRCAPGAVPPEAGLKGEAVADMSARLINHVVQTAPFPVALVALVVMWRDDDGKLACIPTALAGLEPSCIPAGASALRSIADSLDERDYSVVDLDPPRGIGDA